MSKAITITVEGGLIQAIEGIPKGTIVKVLDFDIEGAEEGELATLPNGDKAFVTEWDADGSHYVPRLPEWHL